MNETDMMHGRDWNAQNLAGWLLSEKLDGCRAFWDGAQMWTRSGNLIALPDSFRAQLPAVPLDGEIWAGRGRFAAASDAVRFGQFDDSIRFMVFDALAQGNYSSRLESARAALAGCAVAAVVEILTALDTRSALKLMLDFQRAGAEGLVARSPGNLYRAGRTSEILKLKEFTLTAWMLLHEKSHRPSPRPARRRSA